MQPFIALEPHVKDLGGFSVKRLLPAAARRHIGPFVFFDHMGPAHFAPGQGIDVRPHPHIGLATVTYLFEGQIEHRDSLGTLQTIAPGDVNWMTAGSGIVHSERTPHALRETGGAMHGIQTWVALPKEHERHAPGFVHYPARELPMISLPGVSMRLIVGSAFGRRSPVAVLSDMFYIAVEMEAGASFVLPDGYPERAAYVVSGSLDIHDNEVEAGRMAVMKEGQPVSIAATSASRLMLLGGMPLDGERFLWWNFVASKREAIEEAKNRWREGRFDRVPGETEFIPLPEEPKPPESFS
ncbi:pirin family protein [Noviherbaspirillum sp. DKR-6]|uniref:Pirin family protein n=2 Tax=Noviherbaspirillum pedocola TaxID=2801341 RepID=A0A934T1B4_9BURK|nr:pirin family protein [Noviherbaspirillum pedocola]